MLLLVKRSEINELIRSARACFESHEWALPPQPRWDVTDFGLGDWRKFGLVLINLADEPEYCEKLMYAQAGMTTPAHCHRRKKEDIICRWGKLAVELWAGPPAEVDDAPLTLKVNGTPLTIRSGEMLELAAGSRVTIVPGIYHEFKPVSAECIIGEVSTANDDLNDNFFVNPDVGRYPLVVEDESGIVRVISDASVPSLGSPGEG